MVRKLGKGAFGQVFEASLIQDPSLRVAIKIVEKRQMSSHGMIRRVRNEVAIHHQLNHPNILQLLHFFEDSEKVYLVMELCANGELFSYLKRRKSKLTESEVSLLFHDIGKAVDYLHLHGIVHRDLKLSNILLDGNLRPKIADFGLAIKQAGKISEQSTICGTPNYLAPYQNVILLRLIFREILSKHPFGPAADLWSLGCILFALLTGNPPFESDNLRMTLERVGKSDFEVPFWISSNAQDLIRNLIVHDPNKRLSTRQILSHPFLSSPTSRKVAKMQAIHGPFSTRWLRPIRQATRHGTIALLESGDVWLELGSFAEAYVISGNGATLATYPKGISHSSIPQVSPTRSMSYDTLSSSERKLYEYARRFVDVLKSKTPCIIHSTPKLKSFLMENGPPGDFLVRFSDDSMKIEYSAEERSLKLSSTVVQKLVISNPSLSSLGTISLALRPFLAEFFRLYQSSVDTYCRVRHQQESSLALFPFVVREAGDQGTGQTAAYQPTIPLFRPVEAHPGRNQAAFAFVYKTFIPDIGWCLASTSDEFLLLFCDGITVLVDGRANSIGFHDPKAPPTQWLHIHGALPKAVKKKLAYFPRFVHLLQRGFGHSFVNV